jgi:D-alanyl-D-alanine carboxypeptidase
MSGSALDRLAGDVRETLSTVHVPGCSIALVDPSGVAWAGGVGLADLRARRPASATTVYHLFSGTKLFTATAVLRLAEEGRLRLDESVASYVADASGVQRVTLLHLLSHRSGLKDTLRGFLAVTFPPDTRPTTAEALARYRIVAAREPGRRVEYRNVNYALLGEVVSRVSGLEFTEYVRREILGPLKMDAADFHLTDATRPLAATGYVERWDPMRLVIAGLVPITRGRLYRGSVDGLVELNEYDLDTAAIGGLVGSAPAFAQFLHMHLAGGSGILSQATTGRMQQMLATGAAGIESRVGVGMGWKIGRVGDRPFVNHEGVGAGFTSELRLYPDQKIGIVVLMNGMRAPRTVRAAHRICEAVLGARDDLRA